MFTIGDFAGHGRVSVRMLRHYDAIGLLRPARVDPFTGYRSYEAGQLSTLNRIVALKDLGFTLEQVRTMLQEPVGTEQLRGMLTVRRAELEAAVAADTARLVQVQTRLRSIESEGQMPTTDVIVKKLPSMRVVELTATAASFTPEDIGPVIKPLCAELGRRLAESDVEPAGRLTCYYEESGDEVVIHAAVAISNEPARLGGLAVAELAGGETVATTIHRGSMEEVLPAWQAMARWIEANGYRPDGPARELYLECPDDPGAWVTELQEPVTA